MIDAAFVNELISTMVEKKAYEGIFAAGARPLLRTENGTIGFKDIRFTPDDVIQLLVLLRQKSKFANNPLEEAGIFSFGIKNLGRFTVEYLQQRGSIVVSLRRMRESVFDIKEAITSRELLPMLFHLLDQGTGLFIISGKNQVLNVSVAASLISYITQKKLNVVYTVEKPQTHLLRHNNGVVIQREVGTDVMSFDEAINQALSMNVDVLYLNDVPGEETLSGIFRAVERGIFVMVAFPSAGVPYSFLYLENIAISPITVRELIANSLQLVISPSGFDHRANVLHANWLFKKEEVSNMIRLGNYFELEKFLKKS